MDARTMMVVALAALAWTRPAAAVNACNTPDPGFAGYERWRGVGDGRMTMPQHGGLTPDGGFDLVVHFHGAEPTRKEIVQADTGIVLVGVDLGVGSVPYRNRFADPKVFLELLRRTQKAVKAQRGLDKAFIRRIAVSSWSAGYGALESILAQPIAAKIDAVLLLDSLYGSYRYDPETQARSLKGGRFEPFLAFARQAVLGRRLWFHSHSAIPTPGFASSEEAADHILDELGLTRSPAQGKTELGLELTAQVDRGTFHLRSFAGKDKPAHCGHLGLFRALSRRLARRWQTPAATDPK